jgi:hypothetical protein
MIEAEIDAAINQLRADTMPFLETQRQRLRARHEEVERAAVKLQERRKSAINLQRKIYLDMKSKQSTSVYLELKDVFEVTLWSGLTPFTTTMGYLRKDLCTTSRMGIIFSGRHLLGELGRTHAWFFDRPREEMERVMTSPLNAADEYLGKTLCGNEHLTCHELDIEDQVRIPSQSNDCDFESVIPKIEITIAEGSNCHVDLINLAESISARADAVLNCISVRFAANVNYLSRRERAVEIESARVSKIEKHLAQADINWKLELEIAREYRRWSECAILVNLGTEQDRLQRGVIEQVLTTTDVLLLVNQSELSKMVEKAREVSLFEETHRRWGIETITLPISTPKTIWSFRACLRYLHLEFPRAPTMPDNKSDRKSLWDAAARFGILTKQWSNWFYHLKPDEMWNLHYGDLTFDQSSMKK